MANRVVRLLPAVEDTMARLTDPTETTELRELAPKLSGKTSTSEDVKTLNGLLQFLQSVYLFTTHVSKALTPVIATLYPTIHDLMIQTETPHEIEAVEKFRVGFIGEVKRRFNPQIIPDVVLVAAYLVRLFYNSR
ncbi:hypothetical protein BGW38_001505 [Lunasporangiospora selenospora]|uniref:Uncharacterized protein n=1 Tax=Lunasporangiospora selenospora TaxID=979761 RepID=A0A9P6KIB0_9FUNG|nr:hypothetical protein BGW38_001505 [Lunasporangiospora selenospora]